MPDHPNITPLEMEFLEELFLEYDMDEVLAASAAAMRRLAEFEPARAEALSARAQAVDRLISRDEDAHAAA